MKRTALPSLFFFLACLIISCAGRAQKASPFTYKIIAGANGTFGYDIYRDGRLKIHQPTIPALAGTKGFGSKNAAQKVAGLVISKMKRGETLPTVSVAEMKALGAIPPSATESRFQH